MFDENILETEEITEEIKQSVRAEEIIHLGKDNLPAGPNVLDSDAILVVEGRADVLNLLKYGIKNAVAVGGTNVPPTIADLCAKKVVTAFTHGDLGGELIVRASPGSRYRLCGKGSGWEERGGYDPKGDRPRPAPEDPGGTGARSVQDQEPAPEEKGDHHQEEEPHPGKAALHEKFDGEGRGHSPPQNRPP